VPNLRDALADSRYHFNVAAGAAFAAKNAGPESREWKLPLLPSLQRAQSLCNAAKK
jgi:hypothetical protein